MIATRRALARVLTSAAGAGVGGLAAALFDARAAARAAQVSSFDAWAAAAGLIAPLALGVGLASGAALAVMLPESALGRLAAWSKPDVDALRRERALALGLTPLAALVGLLALARWSLFVLASSLAPAEAGAALGLAALLLAGTLALLVSAWARAAKLHAWRAPAPLACLALGLALSAGFLAVCVATGTSSGAGSVLSMFGVLTRDELDLRPLGLLLLPLVGALAFPVPKRSSVLVAAAGLALLPLGLTAHAARSGLEEPQLALAIERSAPLASRLLGPLRRLSDRDRDGYSARFGGGDCDDARAEVNPGADDLPGNGRDEDCSGSDARPTLAVSRPAEPVGDARELALARVPPRLNVLLLTVDTLRYDLGYAGNPRPVSPALDRLAAEAVVFERAYALASYTAKSLPPMLIGRYASETHRGWSHFNRFGKKDAFLAERLTSAGVHTVSVQGHWYFFQNYGMERGFAVVDSSAAPRAAQAAEGDRSVTSPGISDAVLAKLAEQGPDSPPLFLWAHYTDPHAEYMAHAEFKFGKGSRAAYDGEVAFVDHHLGRVFEALRSGPLWSNTAVIITSDHGEAFGEHGLIRHGFELWEELVRVPMIVRVPGLPAHRVQARRSTIDLVPTILDLMRIPLPDPGGSDALSGTSLLVDLAMPPGHVPSQRPVFVDMAEGPHNAERRAFIDGDLKLVVSGGRPLSLYDLASDPGEKHDLSKDKPRLQQALEKFRAFRSTLREVKVRPER